MAQIVYQCFSLQHHSALETRRFRGAAHPSTGQVGWHCDANKCEGLTIDHQLMKRFGCYPKASLDWAWGELLAGRAVSDPFLLALPGAVFFMAKGSGSDREHYR